MEECSKNNTPKAPQSRALLLYAKEVMKLINYIFRDTKKPPELILPITPSSFSMSHGIRIETVNIHTVGDIALAGHGALPTYKIDCMFPAKDYEFKQDTAEINPYKYVQKFEDWSDNHTVLQFIISDTMVNTPVLIEDITYGEKDGTGDVYATITMRNYRTLLKIRTDPTGNKPRSAEENSAKLKTYVIKKGDCLSSICLKFYGDASLYPKLAKANGIKHPDLIITGKTLKLPDRKLL